MLAQRATHIIAERQIEYEPELALQTCIVASFKSSEEMKLFNESFCAPSVIVMS